MYSFEGGDAPVAVRDLAFVLPPVDRVDAGTVDGFCQLDDPSVYGRLFPARSR